jgi:hypothetical protein
VTQLPAQWNIFASFPQPSRAWQSDADGQEQLTVTINANGQLVSNGFRTNELILLDGTVLLPGLGNATKHKLYLEVFLFSHKFVVDFVLSSIFFVYKKQDPILELAFSC